MQLGMFKWESLGPLPDLNRSNNPAVLLERRQEQLRGISKRLAGHLPPSRRESLEFQRNHLLELIANTRV